MGNSMENWKTRSRLEYELWDALIRTVTPSGTCGSEGEESNG